MSSKKFRNSRIILFDSKRSKTPLKLSPKRNPIRTPSPESVILVKSKVDLLSSFKDSFVRSKSRSKFLTPITKTKQVVPKLDITNLNIKNYGLGDSRAQLLSTAIKSIERLQSLNLRGNGMKETGAYSILHSINKENIKLIDLSSNRLGTSAFNSLCEIISSHSSSLESLNLENTKLSLSNLTSICSSLKHNKSLKCLNLANNSIGAGSGTILCDMLDYNNSLEVLDLQWNFIRGLDIILFSQSIRGNTSLKTLDLSWNSIGHDRIHESASKLFSNLLNSESLEHLDISNNNFSLVDSEIIAEILKNNHKIKGIHYHGNYGTIDPLGFLIPMPFVTIDSKTKGRVRICSLTGPCQENCWICNAWKDVKVEWDPMRVVWNRRLQHFAMNKLENQVEPVYVHFEVDDFKPILLNSVGGVYCGVRALPPGKIRFFFSYRGVAQISNEYQFEVTDPAIKRTCHFYGNFTKEIMVVVLNFFINSGSVNECIPRPLLEEYKPPPGDVPEPDIPPWNLETSVFANFSQPGPDLYNKCFEADWNNSKISKFLKNETVRNECKEIIRKEYQKM